MVENNAHVENPRCTLAMLRSVVLAALIASVVWWLQGASHSLSSRVVVVADLHGDFEHALNVLRMAGVVAQDSLKWSGGKTVLVSTGDLVDRGDDTIALYRLFGALREESKATGGRVVQLFGNHEIMNLVGDWRYVTPGDIASFGGSKKREAAMRTGWLGNEWHKNYQAVARVPLLEGALPRGYEPPAIGLAHGGMSPPFAALGIDAINRYSHPFVSKFVASLEPWDSVYDNTTAEERAIEGAHGPLWYRGFALDDDEIACANANASANALGVRHLVMGHTPSLSGFFVRCDGQVLIIDTGISRAYGGKQSALVFDTSLTGSAKGWYEKSVATALYVASEPEVIGEWERAGP